MGDLPGGFHERFIPKLPAVGLIIGLCVDFDSPFVASTFFRVGTTEDLKLLVEGFDSFKIRGFTFSRATFGSAIKFKA